MTGAKENDEAGKPTDRYQKVKPEEGVSPFSGEHTPLATEIPDVDDEDPPVDSVSPAEDADAVPRPTQRYDQLELEQRSSPPDPDVTPDALPGEKFVSQQDTPIAGATAAGDLTPVGDVTPVGDAAPVDSAPPPAPEEGDDATPAGEDPPAAVRAPVRSSASSKDPLIGKMVGGVVLEEAIGRGGMGSIYRGRHPHLRKEFAIKILPERLAALPPFVDRFINEGRAAARIRHPGAVRVSAAGVEGGIHWIVMELIKGRDLRRIVEDKGQLHEFEVQRVVIETARVLSAAHGVSIIHRDIKPENLLLETDGNRLRVTDFGLSMDTSADLASVEATIGTPNYMSPEQCMGRGCDERSDIYALGATCFFLLTRRPPYAGHTATAVMIRHIVEPPPDPRVYAPRTTDEFAEIVMRMMAKDPTERYASAVDLAKVVEALHNPSEVPTKRTIGGRKGALEARLTRLLVDAQEQRAESIHLVVQPDSAETALRIDGALGTQKRLSAEEGVALADTIKAAAKIPPTAGSPRHGRLEVTTVGGALVPVFVGVLPGAASERLVMRFLPVTPDYAFARGKLGLSAEQDRLFTEWVERSRGVVLATGPLEGCSSSLLYGLIAQVRHRPVSVVTIEPQIDVLFDGVTQLELDPEGGMNQQTALRASLDQDFDVCMIADVQAERWPDVFEAARAGRLLFASGTRPDGVSLLRHLLHAGVPFDHLEQLCLAVVTSRELPIACSECTVTMALEPNDLAAIGLEPSDPPIVVPTPGGCAACGQVGTTGREPVHEVLTPNREILQAIVDGKSDAEVSTLAVDAGATVPLRAILRERVISGRTRIQDALQALEELS